jgi:hypothetical protein
VLIGAPLVGALTLFHAFMVFAVNMPANRLKSAVAPVLSRYDGPQLSQGWPQLVKGGHMHTMCSAGGGSTSPCRGITADTCSDGPERVACAGTAQQCAGVPCDGSQYTINDYFTAPGGDTAKVTDINSIQQFTSTGSWTVGWIYQATIYPPNKPAYTAKFMQGDTSSQIGVSFSISLGIFRVSVTPGARTPLVAYRGWPLPKTQGKQLGVQRCESLGRILA